MDLHPRKVVRQFLRRHGEYLSLTRELLDGGVQDAAAHWEEGIPNFREMDPCSRASHIRQFVAANWRILSGVAHPLTLDVRFNNGLHLFNPQDVRVRVKTRPRNPKNNMPLSAMEWVIQEDVFGNEIHAGPYELAILWTIDFTTSTLGSASLAAVHFGEDDNGPAVIYAEEEIPLLSTLRGSKDNDGDGDADPGSTGTVGSPGPAAPGDDFDEYLEDDGEGYGQDPA